jgi:hypothetical protein
MIAQVGIFAFGMSAVYLANDRRPGVRRWGCVCGLLAQPFWFYETAAHGQWLIFAASLVYAYGWARGFYHQWVTP